LYNLVSKRRAKNLLNERDKSMKKLFHSSILAFQYVALLAVGAACLSNAHANPALTNALVAYWPLTTTNTGTSTPDLQSGYNLLPRSGSSIVTFAAGGMSLNTGGGDRVTNNYIVLGGGSLLGYQSPATALGTPATSLPPTQFSNWTVSLWVKGSLASMPSAGGDRIFACGYSQSTSPVLDFNTGGSGGASGETTSTLDNFVRQYGGSETANGVGTIFANYTGGTHRLITANPWDGTWHNITVVAQMITNGPQPVIQPITAPANSNLTFTFSSIPLDYSNGAYLTAYGDNSAQPNNNQQYILQQSTDLIHWTNVATQATAGYAGTTITYTNATNADAFYRVVQPVVVLQNWTFYLDGSFVSSALQFTNNINVNVPVGVPVPNGNTDYLQNTGNEPGGSDPAAIQPPWGIWQCDQFAVGGLFRTSAGSYLPSGTGLDDVAVWKRALSPAEIINFMHDGITNTVASIPLTVALTADFPAVATNDVENLHWIGAANATNFTITPNVGNVTADTSSGVGSVSAVITSNITYTITATRLGLSTNASVSVIAVSNVSPGWHYIDSFTYLPDGLLNGQGGWLNPSAGIYSPLVPMEVRASSVDGSNYISFDGEYNAGNPEEGGLAGRKLNGDSITLNSANTLFFRFYLDPSLNSPDANLGGNYPDVDCNVGISDEAIRDPIDFEGDTAEPGPCIWIVRNEGGDGGPIDLQAVDGPAPMALTPGGYSYVADTNNGNSNGLSVGFVYSVWIDITNGPAEVAGGLNSGGTQTNGAYYKVWLQRSDWASRTNLFSAITPTNSTLGISYPTGFLVSGRDDSTTVTTQEPSELLSTLFLCTSKNITLEDTNKLRFDDFYLSITNYLSTVPVPAKSMQQ
jgi:hypothetical protein